MVICSTHDLKDLLSHKAMALLSPSRIQLIHVTLLESPEFSFERCPTLNPATLIPNSSEPPFLTCNEMSVVSDSVRPHRRQPTRLPCPWDSPGKNTGVGCHFLLQSIKVKSESEVAKSCPTLSDPMDCSPPGSSVHGIFQARVLEWGAIAFFE